MLDKNCSVGGEQTYIFSLIFLLAQVVFREEVLTLCFNVSVLTLRKTMKRKTIQRRKNISRM